MVRCGVGLGERLGRSLVWVVTVAVSTRLVDWSGVLRVWELLNSRAGMALWCWSAIFSRSWSVGPLAIRHLPGASWVERRCRSL